MNRLTRIDTWYLVLGVAVLHSLWVRTRTVEAIPYSQFEANLDERAISDVTVGPERIRGTYAKSRDGKSGFVTTPVPPELVVRLKDAGVVQGGNDEREQALNQLLSELDGFDPTEGVVLLGATNRPEILDPALLRAGRFDRQVLVDRPDRAGRAQILKVHVRKTTLAADVDLEQIASMTTGMSGAELANLVSEAALLAARRRAKAVGAMDAALGNVSYEHDKPGFLGERRTAYLERTYSEATAEAIDEAVRTILQGVSREATEILAANRDILDRTATRLLDVETLNEAELREMARKSCRPAAVKSVAALLG